MATQNEADLPAFAIIDFDDLRGGCVSLAEAQAKALKDANETRTPGIIVQVIGYTRIPDAPAEFISLIKGDKPNTNQPTTPAKPAPVVASSPAVTATRITTQPTQLPSINSFGETLSSTRVAPKFPVVRNVKFPDFVDILAPDGPDGPATKEQVEAAEAEIKRLGGSLSKTVRSWTGLEANQINSATMTSVITVLKGWVK